MQVWLRKTLWWLLLASSCGMGVTFLILIVDGLSHTFVFTEMPNYCLIGIGFEGAIAIFAVLKLKRLFDLEPLRDNGRWQLSLGDMISIVFFFGVLMSIFRTFNPPSFLSTGLPVSMFLGIGYVVALLFVSRNHSWANAWEKWLVAIISLWTGLSYLVIGVTFQIVLIVIAIALFKVVNP